MAFFQSRLIAPAVTSNVPFVADAYSCASTNTDVIELVPDEPASTGGKEHERIETKNNRKQN